MATLPPLPSLAEQAERLIEAGAGEIGGVAAADLRAAARAGTGPGLLVIHPACAQVSGTGRSTVMHPRSAGAGPVTDTPGWASPPQPPGSRSQRPALGSRPRATRAAPPLPGPDGRQGAELPVTRQQWSQ